MSEAKHPLTFRELAAGVRDDLFQWDRGIVGTFIGLIWKPRRVIRGFLYERDERYANPWRYLIFSVLANVAAAWFVLDNLGYRETLGIERQSDQIAFVLDNAAIITLAVLPMVALIMRLCFVGLNVRYIDALVVLFYTQGQVNLLGVTSVATMAITTSQTANIPFIALTLIYLIWAWTSFASGPIWRRVLAAMLTLIFGQAINGALVYAVVTYLA